MADGEKLFASGQNYDRAMGRWSRIAGERFLEWLAIPEGLRWLDVGCGTGAFTELVLQRNLPTAISAIDPSENLIAFAKSKPSADRIDYRNGDAMSLPYRMAISMSPLWHSSFNTFPIPARRCVK